MCHVALDGIPERSRVPWKLSTEEGVDFCWSLWDIMQGQSYVLMGKSPFLKFCNTNMVEHRSHCSMEIFHEGREVLLENPDNKIRPIICRLTRTELGSYLWPAGICSKCGKESDRPESFA
jgi:hypothetical protein